MGHPKDLLAGSVVFLVALPLCLGIALASNAPLLSGILAGIIGGVVVGFFSGSHTSVSGPAAGLTALVASSIAVLGSFEAFLLSVFLAGMIQVLLGLSQTGFIANFFPNSVIKGLLAAIGLLLILKQIPHLLGYDLDPTGEMAFLQPNHENTFSAIFHTFYQIHFAACLIGISSFFLLYILDASSHFKKTGIPAPLVVVCFGTLMSLFLGGLTPFVIEPEHLVQVPILQSVAHLPSLFRHPDFSQWLNPAIYTSAFTLAIVASLETLLNLEAVDKLDPKQQTTPKNQELVAQGIGNMLGGLVGALPVTSVVIRGTVNINAGAQSRFSTVFHGILLALSVGLFPQLLNSIPLACLAAILVHTGLKLINPKLIKQVWADGLHQLAPFVATVGAIVLTDLLKGIVIGLGVSLLFILHRNWKRPLKLTQENYIGQSITRIELANQVSFLNRAVLSDTLASLKPHTHVLIDATHTNFMDDDILDLIRDFKEETAPAKHIQVSVYGFKKPYLENKLHYIQHPTPPIQQQLSPTEVLSLLEAGNLRFLNKKPLKRDVIHQIQTSAQGQAPVAVFLSCMDSRTSVELIFDLGIGDVFSIRMAGNVVSEKVLGSIEYACAVAGAKVVVVMGHTGCGAVSASIDFLNSSMSVQEKTGCNHLHRIVEEIQSVIPHSTIPTNNTLERLAFESHVIELNVFQSIYNIQNKSQILSQLLLENKILITGCIYDIGSGKVKWVSPPVSPLSIGNPQTLAQPTLSAL